MGGLLSSAERLQGIGRDNDNIFLMYLAQGVGGCAMVNGSPIIGSRGNAGGVGILFPYDKPRPSARDYNDFIITNRKLHVDNNINIEQASDLWIEQVLPSLRSSIDTISRFYDPSHLILSGELPKLVIDKLITKLDYRNIKTGYTAPIGVPSVVLSSFDESIALIGASVLPMSALLTGSFSSRLKQNN
jgi:predicted NBD/HSP70 family sugar kinase